MQQYHIDINIKFLIWFLSQLFETIGKLKATVKQLLSGCLSQCVQLSAYVLYQLQQRAGVRTLVHGQQVSAQRAERKKTRSHLNMVLARALSLSFYHTYTMHQPTRRRCPPNLHHTTPHCRNRICYRFSCFSKKSMDCQCRALSFFVQHRSNNCQTMLNFEFIIIIIVVIFLKCIYFLKKFNLYLPLHR